MWPILMQFLRSNAPYLTLPFAGVIGIIGYNLEGYFSDRYTPYNTNILAERERTFIMITTAGIEQGIIGTVIDRFEKKGLKLLGLKLMDSHDLQKRYSTESQYKLDNKPGPVIPMVWEGLNAVKTGQKMTGVSEARPGTINGEFCVEVNCNIVYVPDTVEESNRGIALWFAK